MAKEKMESLAREKIKKAVVTAKTIEELEKIRIKYLGRKGIVTQAFKEIKSLPSEERIQEGKKLNQIKNLIQTLIAKKDKEIKLRNRNLKNEWLDVTAPGLKPQQGHLHLITQTIREIAKIFQKIGFNRVRYPEIEWDWYAFEGLNMPPNHPARDNWETFFIQDLENKKYGKGILTPHTSSGQLREMEKKQLPIRMLNIAKCYRRQSDISHAPMFYQFEGLLIDKDINVSHLKGTLDFFSKQYFGPKRETRIRPFHFRFTEPSFEVDVTCVICNGRGCSVCKEGWLELGGAGMVHPKVLANGGIDPQKYSGFAWGWGVERLFMMKYKIPDIRLLFSGDLDFLKQF